MRRRMTFTEEVAGVECELTFDPIDDTLCTALAGDKRVAAHLVYDSDYSVEDLMGDCMGKLLSFHRHSRNLDEAQYAAEHDKDAQLLACYEHGGQVWSLSGGGMQCQWDTSNQAGVWVPDEYLREQLDADEKKGLNRNDQARKYCKQFLETYNQIINGEVYGCVVEWFDENGKQIDSESCWGFVGSDHATESLKSEFFDPTCERLRAEYEEDVRTQCGRQMEIPS